MACCIALEHSSGRMGSRLLSATTSKAEPRFNDTEAPAPSFRFVLLGASFDTGNLGVAALAAGTIAAVEQSQPGADLVLFDYGRQPATYRVKCRQGQVKVRLVNIRFSKKPWQANHIARLLFIAGLLRLIPSQDWRRRVMSRNPWLQALSQADMIGAISGGDSFSDIYGLSRLAYVSLPQFLVLLLGKPLVMLPQTLGPFQGRLAKIMAQCLVRRAEAVYSRDRNRLDEIRSLMGSRQSRLRFAYDLGFALEPSASEEVQDQWPIHPDSHRPCVGLNVSGLLFMGGYTQENMFGLCLDYPALVRRIIDYFIQETDSDLILIPHVFGNCEESDATICHKLYSELSPRHPNRLHLVRSELDQHQIKHLIGRCNFFIGSRMHACIAALSQGVPAVSLAYSDKFAGVMEPLGACAIVADLRQQSMEEVTGVLRDAFAHRAEMQAALQHQMKIIRGAIGAIFSKSATDSLPGLRDELADPKVTSPDL